MKIDLSLSQARCIALHAQGLGTGNRFAPGKEGVLRVIEHLGYVQIDTISVVERAHHHVLWTRLPDYEPGMLEQLQSGDRKIFEYWSHAAAFLPISEYRYCLPRMRAYASGTRHWFERDRKVMKAVLARIKAEGPLRAADFKAPTGRKSGPWFDWKPAKTALEQLFIEGTLMVRGRRGFQKIYDLAERVLPTNVQTTPPSANEMARFLITSSLRSHGLALEPEMRYLRKGMQTAVRGALREMVNAGEVVCVHVEGLDDEFYAAPLVLDKALKQTRGSLSRVHLLSPFDNSVIQRQRVKRLFDFDYQIECYTPAPKRKFGYFTLPVLAGHRMIGRIDCKAERKTQRLLIHSVALEPEFRHFDLGDRAFQKCLKRFATFNGCIEIVNP